MSFSFVLWHEKWWSVGSARASTFGCSAGGLLPLPWRYTMYYNVI